MAGKNLDKHMRIFKKAPEYLGGPSSGVGRYQGFTTLASGSSSVTVSTAVVRSADFIRYGTRVSSVGVATTSGGGVVVNANSIVGGVSFAFARATGTAVGWDETIMWEIVKRS